MDWIGSSIVVTALGHALCGCSRFVAIVSWCVANVVKPDIHLLEMVNTLHSNCNYTEGAFMLTAHQL